MKKQILALASIVMIGGVMTFTSCSKEDLTAPVLSITGGNSATQNLPSTAGAGTWTNPTATATDDEDGDISSSVSVSGTVDPNTAGTYTLTYSVSDAAGNTASETVTVTIVNSADYLEGAYNGSDVCQISGSYTYTANVSASNSVNGAMTINNFAAFGTGINVAVSLSGTAISMNAQPIGTTGNLLSGSGTVTNTTTPIFDINFTWTDGTNTESCASNYTHQ